jgi:predicted membrane protein
MLRFFEKFNKGLLFITLVSLIYRKGSFYNSFIPKPFEALLILTLVATLIYLVIGKKFSTFLHAFPKRVLVAAGLLVGSVCIGWIYGIFLRIYKQPGIAFWSLVRLVWVWLRLHSLSFTQTAISR